MSLTALGIVVHVLIEIAFLVRVMTRPYRDPASRIAWVVVIVALPILGMLAYALLGETNIGHRRVARMQRVLGSMPAIAIAKPAESSNAINFY